MSAPATPEQVRQMDAAVAEVRRQYNNARPRVEAAAAGLFATAEAKQVAAQFAKLKGFLEQWATTYRRWAVAGRREDGTAYDVARFLAYGRETLADAIQLHAAEAYDRGLLAAVQYAAEETGKQLTSPSLWPPWLRWGALAAGALVVGAAVVYGVGMARALKAARP